MTNNQLAENSITQLLNSVKLARDNAERDDNRVDHSFYYALTIALDELQERRKAAMDSEPVMYCMEGNGLDPEAVSTRREVVEAWVNEWNTEDRSLGEPIYSTVPLYRHAQPALTPYAWSYDWARCVTCEGPQDFEPVIEREPPPQWAIDEGRVKNLITLYRTAQLAPVVQCPFPCGWDNLNKLAIQNAAFVACALIAGEPATESLRQAAISNNDYLLKVISACRAAMLNGGKS